MVATNVTPISLDIYIRNQRVVYVQNPAPSSILDWLARLDGENVTKLVLMTQRGWLTVDPCEGELNVCFCDNRLDIRDCEIVSREVAADKVLQFIERDAP